MTHILYVFSVFLLTVGVLSVPAAALNMPYMPSVPTHLKEETRVDS